MDRSSTGAGFNGDSVDDVHIVPSDVHGAFCESHPAAPSYSSSARLSTADGWNPGTRLDPALLGRWPYAT